MNDSESVAPTKGHSHFLFLGTILLGSFLLFLVQPMVARMALPRLGGAPAVWNSAMLVYQALLLGGYAYAHRLSRETPQRQAAIHLALLIVAALWLPLGLASFVMPADGSPIFWVPWLLVASIGPLFFAVAAQAPLMQRWYGFAGNAGEPYALYAASNIGSFGGLISYPLLVEPAMPLKAQSWLWTGLYGVLFVAVAACARLLWHGRSDKIDNRQSASPATIGWRRRLTWIVLAAVPSGLMLSTTSHLTTDLMAMPMLWVIPLGLYLLSFSVAFADNRWLANVITMVAPPVTLVGAAALFVIWGQAAISGLAIGLTLLFVIAVALHAEMYRTRPAPEQLTSFYLMMSVGGVIGGFFCAIISPLLFDWTWEHPLFVLIAATLLPQKRYFSLGEEETFGQRGAYALFLVLGCAALAAGIYGGAKLPLETSFLKIGLIVVLMVLGAMVTGKNAAFALVAAGLMAANGGWYGVERSLSHQRFRSYFGTYTIEQTDDASVRWLLHGTTMHGMQLRDFPTAPISYYAPTSGVGLAMGNATRLYGPNPSLGVVGLGTGTLACYSRPGQDFRFFEIDPLMIRIARTSKMFSFVDSCNPDAKVVLGDARLTLAATKPHSIDILALDAFSSDSIPMHLMTKEAFEVYKRVLRPNGLLLVHISNRYIDLNPVVAAEARAGGWTGALRFDNPTEDMFNRGIRPSSWIALSQDPGQVQRLTGPLLDKRPTGADLDHWIKLSPPDGSRLWTDDYASVLPHLWLWKTKE